MSGTHRLTSVPNLARKVCTTCHIHKDMAQNDGVIKKNWCMHACHHWHKCEINLKNHTEFLNSPNLLINIINATCTHRCEVCEKSKQTKTKNQPEKTGGLIQSSNETYLFLNSLPKFLGND